MLISISFPSRGKPSVFPSSRQLCISFCEPLFPWLLLFLTSSIMLATSSPVPLLLNMFHLFSVRLLLQMKDWHCIVSPSFPLVNFLEYSLNLYLSPLQSSWTQRFKENCENNCTIYGRFLESGLFFYFFTKAYFCNFVIFCEEASTSFLFFFLIHSFIRSFVHSFSNYLFFMES